jgi:copper chaperone
MMGAFSMMVSIKERTMIDIKVPDMTCGHCVSTITKAVKALDTTAKIEISLDEHRVHVESTASEEALLHCIAQAGYSPKPA